MLKTTVETELRQAFTQAQHRLGDEAAGLSPQEWQQLIVAQLRLERPRNPAHGDYAVNVSFLAKITRKAPPVIASTLAPVLQHPFWQVEVVGGFINLRLTSLALAQALWHLLHCAQPGKNASLANQRVLLEYISANPTGPLHLGHGRWAALGDSIRRILEHNGATVVTEFYVNDQGQQMVNLANSLWFRALEQLELGQFPTPQEGAETPFPYYPGEYVRELAAQYLQLPGTEATIRQWAEQFGPVRLEDRTLLAPLIAFGKQAMLANQRQVLDQLGVRMDAWVFESDLHAQGAVARAVSVMRQNGFTEERDGALWLKTTALGDEKDRVLIKSDGSYTYLAPDAAYHHDKFTRPQQFNRLINIWGADHHGYVARLKAAVTALGHPAEHLEILLGQLVTLVVDGETARMGKRSKMQTLQDIVAEVGTDATRFWLVSRSADHTIEFDTDLAKRRSDDNPVYYAQYAHARACSIVRMASTEPVLDVVNQTQRPGRYASVAALQQAVAALTPEALVDTLLEPVQSDERAARTLREMVLLLDALEDRVVDAGQLGAPHLLVRYCTDLASQFHSFYNACRVLTDDDAVTLARLALVLGIRRAFEQALQLLGVSAPQQM